MGDGVDLSQFSSTTDDGEWWCKACQWKGEEAPISTNSWRVYCPECEMPLSASVKEAGKEIAKEQNND